MRKPRILVTGASGRNASAAVLDLLKRGFPVRALVRRQDKRAEALRSAGAEIVVGDLFDYRDLERALVDVQRAYHSPPYAPNLLNGMMLFAIAAEQAKLEVVVWMSQWNPHFVHLSAFTREHWMANQIVRWMPSVDAIHVNPGLFAYVYFLGLPAIVHCRHVHGAVRRRPQRASIQRRHWSGRGCASREPRGPRRKEFSPDRAGAHLAARRRRRYGEGAGSTGSLRPFLHEAILESGDGARSASIRAGEHSSLPAGACWRYLRCRCAHGPCGNAHWSPRGRH